MNRAIIAGKLFLSEIEQCPAISPEELLEIARINSEARQCERNLFRRSVSDEVADVREDLLRRRYEARESGQWLQAGQLTAVRLTLEMRLQWALLMSRAGRDPNVSLPGALQRARRVLDSCSSHMQTGR